MDAKLLFVVTDLVTKENRKQVCQHTAKQESTKGTDIMKRKLKQGCNQFHQYQQNEQSPQILTVLTEHKAITTYDVGNLSHSIGQTHQCGWVFHVNGLPIFHS